ncbi:aminotransferase [Burkholderia sp. PAMC 28687]|jgi:nicotinamide mononucleotide transporter|uniref:Nicotinamide riboside transporter PnuC n=1 Tax=Caballeronia sordidicola TaxID=196367 RepID=A0A242N9L5_CABSO|nr:MULTISPECIES: nicotinamide riboside transporter PnuC [Burkholderiaceae]AMH43973.1 aminotransferase [Burkholderia sp. PAMC 26561]AMM16254.1 aminotransferase [Burkholderia sp. PAMC 28687]OTP77876.1 PnuC-like transporter linked to homoserine kinase and OMR [Caballeronia sordidicola]OTP80424.1 PnuC-like transporter linked to homoserine kinase and OMR [Caballeronia sordidicola]
MSVLEIIGVIVSALAIWLTARRRMLCWPVGLASVALYGWIFFDAKLYSDMLLQGAFAVLQVYGWWVWLEQGKRNTQVDSGEVRVQAVTPKALLMGLLLAVIGSAVLGSLMARFTDAALPYVDASLTAFSLVAQYWTARRYIASWWLWIAVDVVYVGMFLFKGLYPTSGLYALFVALAVIGLRDWSRAAARVEPAQTPHAA